MPSATMSQDAVTELDCQASYIRAILIALLVVTVSTAIRALFFGDLGRGTAYLTYYPAIALAALFGGLYVGALATILSALLCFYWIQLGYMSRVESISPKSLTAVTWGTNGGIQNFTNTKTIVLQ